MRKLIAGIILGTALLCGTKAHAQYNREYFFWVGRSCMMNNDYQEAIRTLNTLLRFDEDAFEGYFLRGIAKYNLDDLLGAEDDFSTAIRLNPVYTQAYTYRAITRSRLGNYDDALQDFREAIELRPDLPGPYYSRGVTRLLNQQFKEAIDDFDKFIRQENKVADAFICRPGMLRTMLSTLIAHDAQLISNTGKFFLTVAILFLLSLLFILLSASRIKYRSPAGEEARKAVCISKVPVPQTDTGR